MKDLQGNDVASGGLLPLISVHGLKDQDSPQFMQTADAIGEAARSFGFFRICDHGIDRDLMEATYEAAACFFALPDETKRLYYIGLSSNHRGYVPFTEKGDYPDEVNAAMRPLTSGLICRVSILIILLGTDYWGRTSGLF